MSVVAMLSMAESEGVALTADIIYRYKSINNIVEQLLANESNSTSLTSNSLTVEAENQLSKIKLKQLKKHELINDNRDILLTGATGFFGAYVLWELLKNTTNRIHCLIRGECSIAKSRVIDAMKLHGQCINDNDWQRIEIVSGDLSKRNLGLSDAQWELYTKSVNAIYHCAADVSILKPYEDLKASNVEGTRRIIEFAIQGKSKTLHYVSTLSVFVDATPKPSICSESDKLQMPVNLYGGYAQSKWVAEKMLHLFAENIHRLSIYRLGLLTGKLKKGRAPKQDWFSLILRGELIADECISEKQLFDFTPVDYAAKALVHISLAVNKDAETYHIANPKPVTAQLLAQIMADNSCNSLKTNAAKHDLTSNSSSNNSENVSHNPRRLFKRSATDFDMTNTNRVLDSTNIKMPVIDFGYLKEYQRKILEMN